MSEQIFHIIGISDDSRAYLSPDILEVVAANNVFSGGRRHHELVKSYLPEGAVWIDITVPLNEVFACYASYREIVVFASGDPLFFGFANTVKRELPGCIIRLYPSFNSLQMLAHRVLLPYQDMRAVSLTGRPWNDFDAALIRGEKLIGVLTDRVKTPVAIASRMLEYGYSNYRMTIGEALGNREKEQVRTLLLEEVMECGFSFPNCLILERTGDRYRPFGIPESEFYLLDGRIRMITKMPVRLLSLSMLDLRNRRSFWDVGFCTGSVSIEAKLQFPELEVTSFEQRPEGARLMDMNSRKFGTPGIKAVIGDFLETDISGYTSPDAVFIGGHGGRLVEMLQKIDTVLQPDGVIVFNSVSQESKDLFYQGIARIGRKVTDAVRLSVDAYNPIEILKAQ